MSEDNSKCPQCNGDTVIDYGDECDFCKMWLCGDCIESTDFLGTGWKCCVECQGKIEDFANANDYAMDYDNCEVFMSEIKSNLKGKEAQDESAD